MEQIIRINPVKHKSPNTGFDLKGRNWFPDRLIQIERDIIGIWSDNRKLALKENKPKNQDSRD